MTSEQKALIQEDCQGVIAGRSGQLEKLKHAHVLITGGTGFLGRWIAQLVAHLNDHYDFGVKLSLLASHAQSFKEKASCLAARDDVELIEQDIRQLYEIPDTVTYIIHAAASPDSRLHASDPLRMIDVIVNGTSALLAGATRLPDLRNVVHVSSGLVYGSLPEPTHQISEADWGGLIPGSVGSVYAEAKRCSETVCAAYRNEHRMPIVVVRPFAYVGPYQSLDKPWAINNFLRDALLGGAIRILGDGEAVRSYLYASDMAFWILKVLADGRDGSSYNIGSPESVSLLELANIIVANLPEKREVRPPQMHKDAKTYRRFVPDVTRVKTELGLAPTVTLDQAIKRTLAWNRYGNATSK